MAITIKKQILKSTWLHKKSTNKNQWSHFWNASLLNYSTDQKVNIQGLIIMLFFKWSKEIRFIVTGLNMWCCNACGNLGLLHRFAISHNITFHYELSSRYILLVESKIPSKHAKLPSSWEGQRSLMNLRVNNCLNISL